MIARLACAIWFAVLLAVPAPGRTHALDPGFLDLREEGAGAWRITWRAPDAAGRPLPIMARLPAVCTQPGAEPQPIFDGSAWVAVWRSLCSTDLAGQQIAIDGLERTNTDTLVRFAPADGKVQTFRLTPDKAFVVLPVDPSVWAVLSSYVGLGIAHIWEGPDHLLFVFCLLLLIKSRRALLLAITSFTLAHSITLVAATFGWVRLPGPPVEAVIALSIVFLAYEIALPEAKRDPVARQFPWLIAFGFGLVHGLGFAGALREIGLPQSDVPLALFAFNLGVETGQLLFIAGAIAVLAVLRRAVPVVGGSVMPARIASYAIGSVAAFWVFERLAAF